MAVGGGAMVQKLKRNHSTYVMKNLSPAAAVAQFIQKQRVKS
ncbi:uncharacterized protein G2W53_026650 [Senna tora]|uniref:Uncharacterized protein n=1 Tax=Senna tora TaxID=362788 RepID=A0A834WFA1_9FABA|nr:uncharacterized protein G2W53_026650 [Senna tora]